MNKSSEDTMLVACEWAKADKRFSFNCWGMNRTLERQRERGTEGQRERGTEGQRERGTEGQRERGTEGQRY